MTTLIDHIAEARAKLTALDTQIATKKAARDAHIAQHHAVYETDRTLGRDIVALGQEAAVLRLALYPKSE